MRDSHIGKKQLNVWLAEEEYQTLTDFLRQHSNKEFLADQFRDFLHWLKGFSGQVSAVQFAARAEEVSTKRSLGECIRGVLMPYQKPEQKKACCQACRQRHQVEFWKCFEQKRNRELEKVA